MLADIRKILIIFIPKDLDRFEDIFGDGSNLGIKKTIEWYLKNKIWCNQVKKSNYLGQRLGTIKLCQA